MDLANQREVEEFDISIQVGLIADEIDNMARSFDLLLENQDGTKIDAETHAFLTATKAHLFRISTELETIFE